MANDYPPINGTVEEDPDYLIEFLEFNGEYSDEYQDEDLTQHESPILEEFPKQKLTKKRGNNKKPRANRIGIFTPQEKKQLATEIKERPAIWDLTNAEHHNQNAVALAWKQIGKVLGQAPSDCKTTWIGMKESLRYRKNRESKKSGSAGGEPLLGPSSGTVDWEFAEDLAFLPDTSRKRKTFTKGDVPDKAAKQTRNEKTTENHEQSEEEIGVDPERSGNESFRSNYFYQSQPSHSSKDKKASKEDDTFAQLADNINNLVEVSKTIVPPADENGMVHKTALANIDRMLQKLPPDVVEDTLYEMTSHIYAKLKDSRN